MITFPDVAVASGLEKTDAMNIIVVDAIDR
jgi:hypothetical protein